MNETQNEKPSGAESLMAVIKLMLMALELLDQRVTELEKWKKYS